MRRSRIITRLEKNLIGLLQYGISQELGERAIACGLTVTKIRALSQKDLREKGFTPPESKALIDAVRRKEIDEEVLLTLLENSNYVCNVCKGVKGRSFIVHHIDEYSVSQNNSYDNLIVLCPTGHDTAHRSPNQLTMSITPQMLRYNKANWEVEVKRVNADRAIKHNKSEFSAARSLDVLAPTPPRPTQTRVLVLAFEGAMEDFHVQRIDQMIASLKALVGNQDIQLVGTEPGSFLMLIRAAADDQQKFESPEVYEMLLREHGARLTGVLDERSLREAQTRIRELERVPAELLGWSQDLSDGTHFSRPEKQTIIDTIIEQESSVQTVVGSPGSGKSALLAEIGTTLKTAGYSVLPIKADLLDPSVETEDDLAEWMGLSMRPSALLFTISALRPVILIIDQLDALAGYTDMKTGRLSVLLNLVRRVSGIRNIHVILSARKFEYEHDTRLKTVNAEMINLVLPPWPEVATVLVRHGYRPDGWPEDARELLRSPQALNIFLKLDDRIGEPPFRKYQLLLDQMWWEGILRRPNGPELAQLVTDIADQMADREALWLPAAKFDERVGEINYLVGAGVLSNLGQPGTKIGFVHQTMFEHAARSFTRTDGRLSDFALRRQTSLFVRPKLWAALTYLREADPAAYEVEIKTLLNTSDLRLHLRTLLVEFLAQQAVPLGAEADLFDRAVTGDRRVAAFKAMAGSPGWFERYKRTEITSAMKDDDQAGLSLVVLDSAWSFDPSEVEALIVENWASNKERDWLTWAAFANAERWSLRMMNVAQTIIERTPINQYQLEMTIGKVGVSQPDVALQLVLAKLSCELRAANEDVKTRLSSAPKGDREAYSRWRMSNSVTQPIMHVMEQSNGWDVLEALATENPGLFLDYLWPWFIEGLRSIGERESDGGHLGFPVEYGIDFSFDEENASRRLSDHPILGAIRVALETLAVRDENAFLEWLSNHESEAYAPAQRLFAHVLALSPDRFARRALEFLLADSRRFRLGNLEDRAGTSKRLIAAAGVHWTSAEIAEFTHNVANYAPRPFPNADAEARRRFNNAIRKMRLELLSTLPPDALSSATRRLLVEEHRRFPRSNVANLGPSWIGSPMSADQLRQAQDDEILNAFRKIPDETHWEHPNRMMQGGNIQLSRAFAEFAKANPARSVSLLDRFEPSFGSRAAGYALEAIAEAGDAELVMRQMAAFDRRGFVGEEFQNSAAWAIQKLIDRKIPIREETLDILERWIIENPPSPAMPPDSDEEMADNSEVSAVDYRDRSILWGSSSATILPGGNFPKLDVLVHALLLDKQNARALNVLRRAVDEGEPERCLRPLLHWLRYLNSDVEALQRLVLDVVGKYPRLLLSHEFAVLLGNLHWQNPELVRAFVAQWTRSSNEYFQQLAAELSTLIATVQPELTWAIALLDRSASKEATEAARVGTVHASVNLFAEGFRDRASDILVRLIPIMPAGGWAALFDIFRLADEITPEATWINLLAAIDQSLPNAGNIDATFVVARLQTLLPHEALLVGRIALGLINTWRSELGDLRTATAGSAADLVDLAITLHRLGPETREIGLEIFERLLEAQAYSAKDTLDEIDNRFRSRPQDRGRLPRRNRASGKRVTRPVKS
ncbi:HNH endonuclease [Rhizobium bangladeshense]|uniref:HNH endonuclease n=1 Tax=Rhizobium bangladeshense TaxID=1138189 RepID=UPI001C831382|nr:HNH endonuclease [Rhizobium bangladeshense]MBX4900373.1 AAA family ATPase [Rhizobium bangladeshense]MBX4912574.1 AAA family ATPase [Rhizobium bangladeshense]